jgi:hypothetical protein
VEKFITQGKIIRKILISLAIVVFAAPVSSAVSPVLLPAQSGIHLPAGVCSSLYVRCLDARTPEGHIHTLEELAPSPLFARYAVANVPWTVIGPNGKTVHTIKGQGIYQGAVRSL